MIKRFEDRQSYLIFEDLTEVAAFLAANPSDWTSSAVGDHKASRSWDLGAGYEGALTLARTGWSEGAKNLSDKLSAHMPERDHVDSWRYDVAGELPDIGRHLAGDPMCMKRHGHPKGRQPIISILVNICCSGGIDAKSYANFGAALVNVIDQLENSGRRVELHVGWISSMSKRVTCGWTVKQAQDPLDLAAVAFSIAHPAASRQIGFALAERTDVRRNDLSYGSIVQVREQDWIDPTPGMFCLQGIGYLGDNNSSTLDGAIRDVTRRINTMAGEELVTVNG